MSRLASQEKGGYYAAPPEMAELVCRRIRCEEESELNILDTCCGKGDVLLQFKEHLLDHGASLVHTYGNELEKSRYRESCAKLDSVVNGGYETLRTTPSFNFLWGNPPYDDGGLERMELSFLRIHTLRNEKRILGERAVVALCIPQHVLADVAHVISRRLDDVSVYRFTDEHYPIFKQVVLFGYLKTPPKKRVKRVRSWLQKVGRMGPEALLSLDDLKGRVYTIPTATDEVGYFRGDALEPEELLRDLQDSPVFDEVREKWIPSSLRNATLKRPILPLKPAHIATAIASGAVNGHMGSFAIEAYTRVQITKEVVDGEGDSQREITIKQPVTTTRVFHPEHGIYDLK